jgi:glycosyltransferase involved in cell wall biosynthesis
LGKGAQELTAAWPRVRAALPAAQLVIAGRREAATSLSAEDGVVFAGPLPHADALALLQAADVFVQPSRWPEPYSRAALEAMAAGKPIVAFAVGGNVEQVIDSETGLLAPRGDVEAFAAATARLLGDPAWARRFGEAGRRRLRGELAAERQLDLLTALYEQARAARGKRLRICAPLTGLTERTDQGGGMFHVKNMQALADRGVSCLIPLAFRTDYEPRANWDVRVTPIRRTFKLGALLSNAVFFAAILRQRFQRSERFDLVRIGDLYHVGPAGALAGALCRAPSLGMIHHIDHDRALENAVVGWTARRLDGVMVPSRATAEDVARTFGADPRRIHQIIEGATPPKATPEKATAKARFGLGAAPTIGFIGALQERKNVGFLLSAFAGVARQRPDARLLLVGDGPLRPELERQTRVLGIAEKSVFTGRLEAEAKDAALAAMDVFAFPSLNEGFGLAVAEAMAAGVPVVVSDRGSLPEIVRHEETGFVLPVSEPEIWAQTLVALLADESLRARLSKAAQVEAADRFTWTECARQTEDACRAVLAERRHRRLAVLLNSGDSLAAMRREGQEERFVQHYLRRYAAAFDWVDVYSYGDDRARPFPNAMFVPGRPRWKGPLYAALLPLLHARALRRAALLRVMQAGAALPAILARLLFGARFVVTYGYRYGDFMRVHGRPLYGRWLDLLDRLTLRLAARIIVTTPALDAYVRRFASPDKIVMIPNGADLAAFAPAPREQRPGKRTVLFVGRFTVQKNLPLLVAALAPLRERVRLVCIGDGEEAGRLRESAAEAGLELQTPGVVPHGELPAWHAQADVFVLSSVAEGHPKALLEAMASGLPCVGTDAPGVRDVLRHEVSGLLAAPNAAALGAAIARVLDDNALAAELGRRAREAAAEDYDLQRLLDREIALLNELAGGDR